VGHYWAPGGGRAIKPTRILIMYRKLFNNIYIKEIYIIYVNSIFWSLFGYYCAGSYVGH